MRVELFDFELDPALIATEPCEPRDACKLLHITPDTIADEIFTSLPNLLQPGDMLVFNDSKVIPARLLGTRISDDERADAEIELLLHRPTNDGWRAFAKPGKKLKTGDIITFDDELHARVHEKLPSGEISAIFNLKGEAFLNKIQNIGHMPLPPYIKRDDTHDDQTNYQTVYARVPGSVAAPTAGLHFTDSLMQTLKDRGIHMSYVTLHVGAGTFQPVKVDDTEDHQMHAEFAVISQGTADAINQARANGGRIIAVGTTAMRILETAANEQGKLETFSGDTQIFITPGYRFKIVDRLITNFHLPKSTLFMLVSAFTGLEQMKKAYMHAMEKGYRFYSYGDASLLEPATP